MLPGGNTPHWGPSQEPHWMGDGSQGPSLKLGKAENLSPGMPSAPKELEIGIKYTLQK